MTKQLCAMLLLLFAATSSWAAGAIIGRREVLQQSLPLPPPPPMTLPDCPDKCGDVSIPYPFGTKAGCFLPGFEIVCDDTFRPARPFLANPALNDTTSNPYVYKNHPVVWFNDACEGDYPGCSSTELKLGVYKHVELIDVSTVKAQARVYAPFSFECSDDDDPAGGVGTGTRWTREQLIDVSTNSPFILSDSGSEDGNVLVAIGRGVMANLSAAWPNTGYSPTDDGGYLATCSSIVNPQGKPPTDGSPCDGVGCCSSNISQGLRCSRPTVELQEGAAGRKTSRCSYAMVVQNSWYNFTVGDIDDGGFLKRNIERGVPVVLDFAIRNNGECPPGGTPLPAACRSDNSECANVSTIGGFICKCKQHYHGNPYIPDGCQDIDECTQPDVYNCSSNGICKNRLEGYDCPCKPWMKGDGKNGTCTDIFPLPAKVVVGAIGGLLGTAVVVFVVLLLKQKRKMREFFIKNGGPILEEVKNIKIFKKEELKPILKKSNIIGQGCFGEVYKGHLENQLVAVKKPINIDVAEKEQFANEVIIQSRIIHKNIVKLIGCCLEVDIPMLVYEFVSKGSLHDVLHGSKRNPLDLSMRLSIAAESAEGLAYMHSKTTSTILHGDVKPANILLDDNFLPKISDFGISKLIAKDKEQHTNKVIGDRSYMDPVYLETGLLTKKSDVYSFGIVLLELISRKKATYSENNSLVMSFLDAHKNKRASELFDDEIAVTGNLEDIDNIVEIAVECLNIDVHQRPEMTDIAERLLMLKRKRNN